MVTNGTLTATGERFGLDNVIVTALTYNDDLSTHVAYMAPPPAYAGTSVNFDVTLNNAGPGDSSGFQAALTSQLSNIAVAGSLPSGVSYSNGLITVSSLAKNAHTNSGFLWNRARDLLQLHHHHFSRNHSGKPNRQQYVK